MKKETSRTKRFKATCTGIRVRTSYQYNTYQVWHFEKQYVLVRTYRHIIAYRSGVRTYLPTKGSRPTRFNPFRI